MNARVLVGIVAAASVVMMLLWPGTGGGNPVAQLPEFVIKDQNGATLGAYSASSTQGLVSVSMTDSGNNERFQIQVGTLFVRGADTGDVWYTNSNCTGIPYVTAPSVLASNIAGLRGSTYAIGADVTGALDVKILRGTTINQGNNDLILNSRFRTNAFSGPVCSGTDPGGIDTVLAEEVMDISTFVRPFIAE